MNILRRIAQLSGLLPESVAVCLGLDVDAGNRAVAEAVIAAAGKLRTLAAQATAPVVLNDSCCVALGISPGASQEEVCQVITFLRGAKGLGLVRRQLGLSEGASEDEVFSAIRDVQKREAESLVTHAFEAGKIAECEVSFFLNQALDGVTGLEATRMVLNERPDGAVRPNPHFKPREAKGPSESAKHVCKLLGISQETFRLGEGI